MTNYQVSQNTLLKFRFDVDIIYLIAGASPWLIWSQDHGLGVGI